MTKDRARKQDIRARMAASGEPYSVVARHLAGFEAAGGTTAAEVAACARATLDELGARMGIRLVTKLPWIETPQTPREQRRGGTPREQRRGGVQGMARRLLGAFLHDGTHVTGEGFAEPAGRRYLIDAGPSLGGFVCREGVAYQGRHGWRVGPPRQVRYPMTAAHWLWPLWALTGTAAVRTVGTEAVRGIDCQQLMVEVELALALEAGGKGWPAYFGSGPEAPATAGLAVWIDGEHVRRVRFMTGARGKVSPELADADRVSTIEVELWDFGTSVAHLDWTRFP